MLKKLICAAALFVAAMSNATAQTITFAGGGQVTAATDECFAGPIFAFPSLFLIVGIQPANVGSNSADTSISIMIPPFAGVNITLADASLTGAFQKAKTLSIGLQGSTYNVKVAGKNQKPAVIDADTETVQMNLLLRGFNGIAACRLTIRVFLRNMLLN